MNKVHIGDKIKIIHMEGELHTAHCKPHTLRAVFLLCTHIHISKCRMRILLTYILKKPLPFSKSFMYVIRFSLYNICQTHHRYLRARIRADGRVRNTIYHSDNHSVQDS